MPPRYFLHENPQRYGMQRCIHPSKKVVPCTFETNCHNNCGRRARMSFYSCETEVDSELSKTAREREREGRGVGGEREREREREKGREKRIGCIAHALSIVALPTSCMHSVTMRRYSSQAEEHQKHVGTRIECTAVFSPRYARRAMRNANDLRSDNKDLVTYLECSKR